MRTFRTVLQVNGNDHVELPFDAKEMLGRVRVPVRVTVNGETPRTAVARYDGGDLIGFNRRELLAAAGISAGEGITVRVAHDTEPRIGDLPPDLAAALASAPDAAALDGPLPCTTNGSTPD